MPQLSYPGKSDLGIGKFGEKLALGHTRSRCSDLISISRPEFEFPETSARVRARCAAGVRKFCGGRLPARTRRSTFRIDRSKGDFPLGASNGGAERRARRRMSLALYLSRVRSSYLLDDMPALLDLIAWRILTLPSRAVAQRVFYRCEPLTVHTHIPGLCEEQNAPRISWTEAL